MRGPSGRDEAAAGLALLGVGLMLALLVLAYLHDSVDLDTTRREQQRRNEAAAALLASVLATSGVPADWESDGDAVGRFGLLDESVGGTRLDAGKIRALRRATPNATSNDLPDYPDVVGALALGPGERLHLRLVPEVVPYEPGGAAPLRMRVAYVGDFAGAESAASRIESGHVAALVEGFRNATGPAGDKFPDTPSGVNQLRNRLLDYDVVLVGSNVEHAALDQATFPEAVRDFVRGGGVLLVLGTAERDAAWQRPLEASARWSASGGLRVVDDANPVLTVPNRLNVLVYETDAPTEPAFDSYFVPVRTRLTASGSVESLLSVGRAGAHGDGLVVRTAYRAFDLSPGLDDPEEGRRFLHNLLTQAYLDSFLSYGPTVHAGSGTASGTGAIAEARAPGGVLRVRVEVFVGGG